MTAGELHNGYLWRDERRSFATCYVCYSGGKEIGLIPLGDWGDDPEWQNWWNRAFERHEDLTLDVLMTEIEQRWEKRPT